MKYGGINLKIDVCDLYTENYNKVLREIFLNKWRNIPYLRIRRFYSDISSHQIDL